MPVGVYVRTESHKQNLSKAVAETQFSDGHIPWNKGIKWRKSKQKPFSKETIRKMSLAKKGKPSWNKGICGDKSHSWKGGLSKISERLRTSSEYKHWRKLVFRRDRWTCLSCGYRGHGNDIEAHHIVTMTSIIKNAKSSFNDEDDVYQNALNDPLMVDISNGKTLCKGCHIKTHKKERKKKMKNLKSLIFALLLVAPVLLGSQEALAFQTKAGNYEASDEIWSNVKIHDSETTVVDLGTVLEFDTTTDSAEENSYTVRVANASADHSRIAGVAQSTIATGDTGRVLVRGKGQVKAATTPLSTGDYMYASSTAGSLGSIGASGAKVSAFALETKGEATATIDAYIVVV